MLFLDERWGKEKGKEKKNARHTYPYAYVPILPTYLTYLPRYLVSNMHDMIACTA